MSEPFFEESNHRRSHSRAEERARADLAAELAFHFETTVDELLASGMTRDEAEREALRRFGDVAEHRRRIERIDDRRLLSGRLEQLFDTLSLNIRYALRGLRRTPGFTACVIVTLALGIGLNATMFEILDRLLLSPPPHVADARRVRTLYVELASANPRRSGQRIPVAFSYPDYVDLLATRSFDALAVTRRYFSAAGQGKYGRHLAVMAASGAYFELLGVRPRLGRLFGDTDDQPSAQPSVVLSYRQWKQYLGGDPQAIGRSLQIGSLHCVIIGIAPPGFAGVSLEPIDAWVPIHVVNPDLPNGSTAASRHNHQLQALGRLASGVSAEVAEQEATILHRAATATVKGYDPEARIGSRSILPTEGAYRQGSQHLSVWLAGVAVIVLLISAANVANLLTARGLQRRREIAVRVALGVGRWRLGGQFLTESLVLASLATVTSLLVWRWGGSYLRSAILPPLGWEESWTDPRMWAVMGLSCLLAGLFTGLVPTLRLPVRNVADDLRLRGVDRRAGSWLRSSLQLAQAALCIVLLVGAASFVKSLGEVNALDLGLDPKDVSILELEPEPGDDVALDQIYDRLVHRLSDTPGVVAAAAATGLPLRYSVGHAPRIPGRNRDSIPRLESGGPYFYQVGREYFRTLDLRILRGRGFDESDDQPGAPRVAIVNQTMATLFWPGEEALGKCLLIGSGEAPCSQVVGIVENSRRGQIVEEEQLLYYAPLKQSSGNTPIRGLLVKVDDDSRNWGSMLADMALSVPEIRLVEVTPLNQRLDPQKKTWQLGALLFSAFAVFALVVAAVGLYSILAFDIAQRKHELGIRSALGATAKRLMSMVLADAMRIALLGLSLGVAIVLLFGDAIQDLLFQTSPHDPALIGAAVAVLLLSAVLAGILPAWRAGRSDPVVALRAE